MNKIHLTFIGLFLVFQTNAQLLNEIGVFVGGSNYSGDIGNELYIFPNKVGGGFIYKRNINSRISARASYSYLPIADNDLNSSNVVRQTRGPTGKGYNFTNKIKEIAIGIEFNYFDYDVMSIYNGFTPYIIIEFAGFYYKNSTDFIDNEAVLGNKFSYAIPFGVGYKSKLTDYLGYALELRGRYTFEDDLDYNNQEFAQLRYGNKNTNDWYFFTGISLTYSFGRPPCAVSRP